MSERRHRWVCPECGDGVLGPQRPRMNNVVRYCLPCSATAGVLIERTCPTLERKRAAKTQRRKTAAARKKENLRERSLVKAYTEARELVEVDVFAEVRECCALLGIREPKVSLYLSEMQSGTSGRAWPDDHRLHITTPRGERCSAEELREVVLHECVHLAGTVRKKDRRHRYHGPQFKRRLYDAALLRWPEVGPLLVPAEETILSRHAYDLDRAIVSALRAASLVADPYEDEAAA